MKKLKHAYLRSLRICSGLEQKDIAFLLGLKCSTSISKFEDRSRNISLKHAINYAIIFATPLSYFFYHEICDERKAIKARAKALLSQLKKQNNANHSQRIASIELIIKSLTK